MISHVVAHGKQREIGKDNALLWHLPDDLKQFKAITTGQTVIMGRRTYESIGRALPNRRNIVVTSDTAFTAPGIEVWHDLKALEELADSENVCIIGGATLYEQTMKLTERFYVTEVDGVFEADTFYPAILEDVQLMDEQYHLSDDRHAFSFTFRQYDKLK